jgi:molybdopterin synthase catalytic subunit
LIDIAKAKINVEKLYKILNDKSCGAAVFFEGRVRNHNHGKEILELTYECYMPMALKTMRQIKEEVSSKYDVEQIIAVHRIGNVPIGEVAVWIGVLSVHRKEAFDACQCMIDEIKQRVPIWKLEKYADGNTKWVECCKENNFQEQRLALK